MDKPKLTYFDFPGSRGEECRLALTLAGVEFHDERLQSKDWPPLKPNTPFGSLPVLTLPNGRELAQSTAILGFIGKTHGLLPEDSWEAAQHESVMLSVEELRHALSPSGKLKDPGEKQAAREAFTRDVLLPWAERIERRINGPFLGGSQVSVADIKLYQITHAFKSGTQDYIPTDVLAQFHKLETLYQAFTELPAVQAWYAQST